MIFPVSFENWNLQTVIKFNGFGCLPSHYHHGTWLPGTKLTFVRNLGIIIA